MIGADTYYAPAAVRDRFLDALDHDDSALCSRLAANLTGCMNPLPGVTCNLLGLPRGSTYGSAARRVLILFTMGVANPETVEAAGPARTSNALTPDRALAFDGHGFRVREPQP